MLRTLGPAAVLFAALALGVSAADAAPASAPLCTPPGELAELSGLATDGTHWYAVNDGGDRLEVVVLDHGCRELKRITADVDPYDVEDLARAKDGTFWIADAGDNDLDRPTVAVHRLTPEGEATLYRLTYPDGQHDSEAILLDADGVPYLVTKELLGPARIYRPAGKLVSPGPTPLEQVGQVQLGPTDTPGGPIGSVGSSMVTGGAVSPDGTVVALRTYTDAYLFSAEGGKVAGALRGEPVRIPLPNETQGEAVAVESDGTLLSGSESGDPIRAVRNAVADLDDPASVNPAGNVQAADEDASSDDGDDGLDLLPGAVVAIVLVLAFMGGFSLLTRARRARRR